jgi:hypothetical protein
LLPIQGESGVAHLTEQEEEPKPLVKTTLSAIGYKLFPFYIYYFPIAVSLATRHIILIFTSCYAFIVSVVNLVYPNG